MRSSSVALGLGLVTLACGDAPRDIAGATDGTPPWTSNDPAVSSDSSGVVDPPGDTTIAVDGSDGTTVTIDSTGIAMGTSEGSSSEGGESDESSSSTTGGAAICQNQGPPEFSYIWIANSSQGTVSKIDTETMVEVGRYIVRPDGQGDPSRTSVSLSGDVAVANRSGGVTKIYARLENCPDPVNTAIDANYLPWQDGCIAWHTPMQYASQRPVAWAPGVLDPVTCTWSEEKLWTSGSNATITVMLLDGATGIIEQTVPIPGVNPDFYGIYGAASDGDGNFWGTQLGGGMLIRVDRQTFNVQTWPTPAGGYGMAVDENGRPWTCSSAVARFDPPTQTWQTNFAANGNGGCMPDGQGRLWLGGYGQFNQGALVAIDINTLAVLQTITLPNYAHGVSVDYAGNIWGVTLMQPHAYRVDPTVPTIDTFTGLTGPYTYSDMTGHGLSVVVGPS